MKSAKDLQKLYCKWKRIDGMYNGEKSDWREIHSCLWAIEFELSTLTLRKDENLLFCDYVRLKMLEDIRYEKNRVAAKDW